MSRARREIRIEGTVQGVGFRPAMHHLAAGLALGGFVRNDPRGVWIEVEGEAEAVSQFLANVPRAAPAAARIERVESRVTSPIGEVSFRIETSAARGAARPVIPADRAPCEACLREMSDPADRRHRYPFTNCTDCGPRFTIVRDVPYDRARTTMDRFPLCAECRAEYIDPASRRFHAEPNACPACGPRLELIGPGDSRLTRLVEAPPTGDGALMAAARALAAGRIVAVKGIGGYLLACDAANEEAVARLRRRKQRLDKPLAVMARDLDHVDRIAVAGADARAILLSAERPILLLPSRSGGPLAPSVAPGLNEVGVALPATPLQHLLLADGPPLQVMTSGNFADEPIAAADDDARKRLSSIADLFLCHDREIHTRADDSVVRIIAGEPRLQRRARGFAPDPIPIPVRGPCVLALGGELKSALCLASDGQAILSQHLGDLAHPEAAQFFGETIEKMTRLLGATPRALACDLHPDFHASRWAIRRAREQGLPLFTVQHHHAHIAACLAEHGRTRPAIGVAFDGTGLGPDGGIWGGEFLLADLRGFRRLGHLRPLALPGGEAAIVQPWRLAAAALVDADEPLDILARLGSDRLYRLRMILDRAIASPRASSAGRWFDAVAALCGLRDRITYEGQAAVQLEAAAWPETLAPYDFDLGGGNFAGGATVNANAPAPFQIDLRPAVRQIAAAVRNATAAPEIAARFHETMAQVIRRACVRARREGAPPVVALSGGCFQNRRLAERAGALLAGEGFEVLLPARVPANDGGLALGQAAVATARLTTQAEQPLEVAVPCA